MVAEALARLWAWEGATAYSAPLEHIALALGAFGLVSLFFHLVHYRVERLSTRRAVGMKGDVNLR